MSRIFISYAREDRQSADRLYSELEALGFEPWLDTVDLLPGARWKNVIKHAIKTSSHFMALMSSNSVTKRGYVQGELKKALEVLEEVPEDEIFIIPVRLDPCKPTHAKLKEPEWVDLFASYEDALDRILKAIAENYEPRLKESRLPAAAAGFMEASKKENLQRLPIEELEIQIDNASRALDSALEQLVDAWEQENPNADQMDEVAGDIADALERLEGEKQARCTPALSSTQEKILVVLANHRVSKSKLPYKLRTTYGSPTSAAEVNRVIADLATAEIVEVGKRDILRLTDIGRKHIEKRCREEEEFEKDFLIHSLLDSGGFKTTRRTLRRLVIFNSYTDTQLNDIVRAAVTNEQVHWIASDSDINRYLRRLVEGNEERIKERSLRKFVRLVYGANHESS